MLKRFIAILFVIVSLLWPSAALANSVPDNRDLPTWDWNYQRTASAVSISSKDPWISPEFTNYMTFTGGTVDFEIPSGQYAMVNPVYVSATHTVYQITYDLAGNIAIWAYTLPPGKLKPGDTIPLNWGTNCILTVSPSNYGGNPQAPEGLSISPDGKTMAFGVGNTLFYFPVNGMAQVPWSSVSAVSITKDPSAVTSSPLFTPDSQYVIIGDYAGGFVSVNINDPAKITRFFVRLSDASHGGSFRGGCPYEGNACTGDAITSTPAWNPGLNGSYADVWFGVADTNASGKSRLVMFNPYANGGFGQIDNDNIGLGIIRGAVWSPVAVDPNTGDVFHTDDTGDLYWFTKEGTLRNLWTFKASPGKVVSNIAIAPLGGKNGEEAQVAWAGPDGRLYNALAHADGTTGTSWAVATDVFKGTSGKYKTLDPRFIISPDGSLLGEAFEDNRDGTIYYSVQPFVPGAQNVKYDMMPQNYVFGYTSADFDLAVDGTYADKTYMSGMPDQYVHVISSWSNKNVNGKPAIIWYLPKDRELVIHAESSGKQCDSPGTLSVNAGDTVSLTRAFYQGAVLNDSNSYVELTLTSQGPPLQKNTLTLNYSGDVEKKSLFENVSNEFQVPQYTSSYTITVVGHLYANGQDVVNSEPITINVTVPNISNGSTLRLDAYRDQNINNHGKNAGGDQNEIDDVGDIRFGDALVATLTVPVPPPPDGWEYDSSSLSATISYPWCDPKPTGTGTPGNDTICTTKTNQFSVTHTGSDADIGTTNFLVSWPSWHPPVGVMRYTWSGTLTANWRQTVVYKRLVCSTDDQGNTYCWWEYQTQNRSGSTNSKELRVVGTEIYAMPGVLGWAR